LKTGKVLLFSILLIIIALLGYGISNSFLFLLLFSIPMGFGAGSIDTALNHYVAVNYKPHHMNWLHSFWGIGATAGPTIMAYFLVDGEWRNGFIAIAALQFIFLLIITLSLPLWKDTQEEVASKSVNTQKQKLSNISGVWWALSIFTLYVGLEISVGVWGSSYLILSKSILSSTAATIIAFYYGGITLGRFLSGLASFRLTNKMLIFSGIALAFVGSLGIIVFHHQTLMTISFVILGIGLSPIFPSMVHDTPKNFGEEQAQYVIGYQIAFAYIGGAIFPPIIGFIIGQISIELFPYLLFFIACILFVNINALFFSIQKKKA
jgi:fucose permease